jgi:hypothetical protein
MRPRDPAAQSAEQAHLMRVSQRHGELVTVSGLEPEALPERSRTATEKPCPHRTLFGRTLKRKGRKGTTPATGALSRADRHTPDQRMPTITADLIPRGADDRATLVTLDPKPHARRIQTTQGEIDLAQVRRQRLHVGRLTLLKIHTTRQPPEPVWT